MPAEYLRRYCRKGTGDYEGWLLIERELREHVRFAQVNLNVPLPEMGRFDIVFLRNVMIYFNDDTKRNVVTRVASTIKPGGWFLVGHSETLTGLTDAVEQTAPSIYRKPA